MDQSLIDRRTDVRAEWPIGEPARATLRPGHGVQVLDVSAGGVLVQADRPLRPGARVHFQLATELRAFAILARVLRCAVWTLDPRQGVTYRGALEFDQPCDLHREVQTRPGSAVPTHSTAPGISSGMAYPAMRDGYDRRSAGAVK
jgi:hypothetical protein